MMVKVADDALTGIVEHSFQMRKLLSGKYGSESDKQIEDSQIVNVLDKLPELLGQIPSEKRDYDCDKKIYIAVSCGLFDCVLNYVWNYVAIEIREKIEKFGVNNISKCVGWKINQKKFDDLRDSGLLDLCKEIGLLTEPGYNQLNICRTIRNNFSAAHKPIGEIGENQLVYFIEQCIMYTFVSDKTVVAVDLGRFQNLVRKRSFSDVQTNFWSYQFVNATENQRLEIYLSLLEMYCNTKNSKWVHATITKLCSRLTPGLTMKIKIELEKKSLDILERGNDEEYTRSIFFLKRIGAN